MTTKQQSNRSLTPAEAKVAIEEIESDCASLIAMRASIGGKLEGLEQSAGERYLNGDRSAIKEIGELRGELDLIERALGELDRRKAVAALNARRVEAADLRRQAEAKSAELGTLEKETGKLLSGLSALEGISYSAGILSGQWQGLWYGEGLKEPQPWQGAMVDLYPDPTNNVERFALPRSRRLRREIAELQAKAAAIEKELTREPSPAPRAFPPDYETTIINVPPQTLSNRSYANKGADFSGEGQ